MLKEHSLHKMENNCDFPMMLQVRGTIHVNNTNLSENHSKHGGGWKNIINDNSI